MNKYKTTIDFIRKLYDNRDVIHLHEPKFDGNEIEYLKNCIESTFVSSIGNYITKFEKKLANFFGVNHVILCVNGTNSIHLSLLLADVNKNDEVLTQALTFIATTNAISYTNAIPVFIDVDKDTMGMSPKSLKLFLSKNTYFKNGKCYNKISNRKISACLPMHSFGRATRIDEIKQICDEYKINLVEDAAEAMGSYYKSQHLGSFGKIGVVSFNGNKIMTTGGGGAILTNDSSIAEMAKHLSTQAKKPHLWEYKHDKIGYNYRMPNLNAALGLAQFEQLEYFLERKRILANLYKDFFKDEKIDFLYERNNEKTNFWLNCIILNNKNERDQFLRETNNAGIRTRPAWDLVTNTRMYKDFYKNEITNSIWLSDRIVNLPSSVI